MLAGLIPELFLVADAGEQELEKLGAQVVVDGLAFVLLCHLEIP